MQERTPAYNSVFIKLWLDIEPFGFKSLFAFVVNWPEVFQMPQLHKHFNVMCYQDSCFVWTYGLLKSIFVGLVFCWNLCFVQVHFMLRLCFVWVQDLFEFVLFLNLSFIGLVFCSNLCFVQVHFMLRSSFVWTYVLLKSTFYWT